MGDAGNTFLSEGVGKTDLAPLEYLLGDACKVPVTVLEGAHKCGGMVRGLTITMPGTAPFPSSLFALEGFQSEHKRVLSVIII